MGAVEAGGMPGFVCGTGFIGGELENGNWETGFWVWLVLLDFSVGPCPPPRGVAPLHVVYFRSHPS
jgi:hypothetical protein